MKSLDLTLRQKVYAMSGAMLGMLLAALDNTIVNTAGPRIEADLRIAPANYIWITIAYRVGSSALVPVYGKLSDVYGRRRILVVAIGVFLGGSLLCGVSKSSEQLIAARGIQGMGAAGLFTIAYAITADLFLPAERARWMTLLSSVFAIASVVGPLAGGALTDYLSWHWAFFVNLPVGALALLMIGTRMPPLQQRALRKKTDVAGVVALLFFTVPLLVALSSAHVGTEPDGWSWGSPQVLILGATGSVALFVFVLVERRAVDPILDLKLFRLRGLAVASVMALSAGALFLVPVVFLPLFMMNVVNTTAMGAGLTMVPLTLGIVVGNAVSGQLVSRLGNYKTVLIASLVLAALAHAWLAFTLSANTGQLELSIKMVVLGLGIGPSIPLLALAFQNIVPRERFGVGTGMATFFRQTGNTFGVAIAGAILAASFISARDVAIGKTNQHGPIDQPALVEHGDASGMRLDKARAVDRADQRFAQREGQSEALRTAAHRAIDQLDHDIRQALAAAIARVLCVSLLISILSIMIALLLPAGALRTD